MSQVSQKRTWQAIALLLAFTLTIALVVMVPLAGSTLAQLDNNGSTYQSDAPAGAIASHRLIVQLQSPPLAELSASTGLARTANGRLDVRSPCMNAGSALSGLDADLDGNPRPQNGAFDLGAYEVNAYAPVRPVVDSFTADTTDGFVPFDVTDAL